MASMFSTERAIRLGHLYPLPEFKQISGLKDFALRTARRNGLRVRRVGGRGFVYADDFLAYLDALSPDNHEQ